MLLYKIAFQQQGFRFVAYQYKFYIDNLANQYLGFRTLISIIAEIRTYTVLQILCLADINKLSLLVEVLIYSGRGGKCFQNGLYMRVRTSVFDNTGHKPYFLLFISKSDFTIRSPNSIMPVVSYFVPMFTNSTV